MAALGGSGAAESVLPENGRTPKRDFLGEPSPLVRMAWLESIIPSLSDRRLWAYPALRLIAIPIRRLLATSVLRPWPYPFRRASLGIQYPVDEKI